jgi:hypothetical protein
VRRSVASVRPRNGSGRGPSLGGSRPFLPYSPECVEGGFPKLRLVGLVRGCGTVLQGRSCSVVDYGRAAACSRAPCPNKHEHNRKGPEWRPGATPRSSGGAFYWLPPCGWVSFRSGWRSRCSRGWRALASWRRRPSRRCFCRGLSGGGGHAGGRGSRDRLGGAHRVRAQLEVRPLRPLAGQGAAGEDATAQGRLGLLAHRRDVRRRRQGATRRTQRALRGRLPAGGGPERVHVLQPRYARRGTAPLDAGGDRRPGAGLRVSTHVPRPPGPAAEYAGGGGGVARRRVAVALASGVLALLLGRFIPAGATIFLAILCATALGTWLDHVFPDPGEDAKDAR